MKNFRVIYNNKSLDFEPGATLDLEWELDNVGDVELNADRVYQFYLPATENNMAILGGLRSIHLEPQRKKLDVIFELLGFQRDAVMTIHRYTDSGYEVSIGTGIFASDWMNRKLRELPLHTYTILNGYTGMDGFVDAQWPDKFCAFPTIYAPNYFGDWGKDDLTDFTNPGYRQFINDWDFGKGNYRRPELHDGSANPVFDEEQPLNNQIVVPQVFVMHILQRMAQAANYGLDGGFVRDTEMHKLYLFNNRSVMEPQTFNVQIESESEQTWVGDVRYTPKIFDSVVDDSSSFDEVTSVYGAPHAARVWVEFRFQIKIEHASMPLVNPMDVQISLIDSFSSAIESSNYAIPVDGLWREWSFFKQIDFASAPVFHLEFSSSHPVYDEDQFDLTIRNITYNIAHAWQNYLLPAQWDLKKCVPDVTVGDFLIALKSVFNLDMATSNDDRVFRVNYIERQRKALPRDWQSRKTEVEELQLSPESYLVGWEQPSDDAFKPNQNFGWYIHDGIEEEVLAEGGTRADHENLTPGAPLPYRSTLMEEIEGERYTHNVPWTLYEGREPLFGMDYVLDEMRFMFYVGLSEYPKSRYSAHDPDLPSLRIGDTSLMWTVGVYTQETDYTIYNRHWRQWINLLANGLKVRMPVVLNGNDIQQLDRWKPVRIFEQKIYPTRVLVSITEDTIVSEMEGIRE